MSFMFKAGLVEINSDKTREITSEYYNLTSPEIAISFGKNFLATFGIHYLFKLEDN